MQLNEQSRLFYDKEEEQYHRVNSEKQIRWYTDNISMNKSLQYGNSLKSIDDDNKLQPKPTRLNEIYDVNTELFGTAPLKSKHDGPVDIESELFHSYNNTDFRKPVVEENEFFSMYRNDNEYINKGLKLYSGNVYENDDILSKSTRNEYRNTRINDNCFN